MVCQTKTAWRGASFCGGLRVNMRSMITGFEELRYIMQDFLYAFVRSKTWVSTV